jgi:hypothetical protein
MLIEHTNFPSALRPVPHSKKCVHLRHQSWSLKDDSDDKELDVDNRNYDKNMYCLIQMKPI